MKKEKLKQKLEILKKEMIQAEALTDDDTREYLCNLEKLVKGYLDRIDKNELKESNGDSLGFRRVIIENDSLAEIDSLYDAACEVDTYYSMQTLERGY